MPPINISWNFVWSMLSNRWVSTPYPNTSFKGKTIIVTGSNSGIGIEAARHFTRLDAHRVILAVRNLEKGNAARRDIETSTLRLNVLEVWKLDMASFASVMEFVERVNGLDRLDVCLLNAAVVAVKWNVTEDCWEESLQVNLLSTVLLALHMLAKQTASSRAHPGYTPRLTMTVSVAYELTKFLQRDEANILQFLNREKCLGDPTSLWERYSSTKLFLMYCAREMAKLVPDQSDGGVQPVVVVNMVHPGFCHSELARDVGAGYKVFAFLLAKSSEKGGSTLVDAAVKGAESHGKYLSFCRVTP